LHLHTDKHVSALPFVEFPRCFPLYPSRLQVAAYLQSYWRLLQLNVRFESVVARVERSDTGGWRVTLATGEILRAAHVVLATGQSSVPNDVVLGGERDFRGEIIHGANYKNGSNCVGKRCLVVGIGNTAQEIVIDLVEHRARRVVIFARSPLSWQFRDFVPNLICGSELALALGFHFLPTRLFDSIAALTTVTPASIRANFAVSKEPTFTNIRRCRPPLLDIGLAKLVKDGCVEIVSKMPTLSDFDVLIKATGYLRGAASFPYLPDAASYLDSDGLPKTTSTADDLHFVGYHDAIGRFRHITLEAIQVADIIAASHRS
jgi:hypothetical protein